MPALLRGVAAKMLSDAYDSGQKIEERVKRDLETGKQRGQQQADQAKTARRVAANPPAARAPSNPTPAAERRSTDQTAARCPPAARFPQPRIPNTTASSGGGSTRGCRPFCTSARVVLNGIELHSVLRFAGVACGPGDWSAAPGQALHQAGRSER